MVRVAIVEDNKRDADILNQYIKRFAEQKNYEEIIVDCYDNGFQFIADYKAVYDIIFLDIEMPQMDGRELAEKIRELNDFECCAQAERSGSDRLPLICHYSGQICNLWIRS